MVKHGYNENWHERDKVYEEMPDAIMRILFHSRPNVVKGCLYRRDGKKDSFPG